MNRYDKPAGPTDESSNKKKIKNRKMSNQPADWSYEEVSTFAMLYAASVDAEISEEEEHLIRSRIDAERYAAVRDVFDQCSDSECINQILRYHDKFFATEEGREKLLSDFRAVFEADQRYSAVEQELMKVFQRIL